MGKATDTNEIYDRIEHDGGFEDYDDVVNWLTKKGQKETEGIRRLAHNLMELKEEKKFAEWQMRKMREIPPDQRYTVIAHQVNGVTIRTHVVVKWDKPELKYLKANYKKKSVKEIATELDRSESSIRNKYARTFKRQLAREKRRRK